MSGLGTNDAAKFSDINGLLECRTLPGLCLCDLPAYCSISAKHDFSSVFLSTFLFSTCSDDAASDPINANIKYIEADRSYRFQLRKRVAEFPL